MNQQPATQAAPLLLVIDTCGAMGTIALARVGEFATVTVAEENIAAGAFASLLVSAISDILNRGSARVTDLAAIAVVHGPGSFTGVRIGVAAAKALAQASGRPLIAVSRLAVLCSQANVEGLCCGLLDAGRGDFYAGFYRGDECVSELLMTREELEFSIAGATLVAAEAPVVTSLSAVPLPSTTLVQTPIQTSIEPSIQTLPHVLIQTLPHVLIQVPMPSAADAAVIAAARLRLGLYDDPVALDGNYLRRTDAQLFAKPQAPAIQTPRPGANRKSAP